MFTVQINSDEISPALQALAAAVADLSEPLGSIGEYLIGSTRERFSRGTGPDGATWAAKSAAALASSGDSRPLFGSSGMLNSQIVHQVNGNTLEVGSSLIYAAMMQFGGTKARFPHLWGDIPARPFLGLSPEDEHNLVAEIEEWILMATDA